MISTWFQDLILISQDGIWQNQQIDRLLKGKRLQSLFCFSTTANIFLLKMINNQYMYGNQIQNTLLNFINNDIVLFTINLILVQFKHNLFECKAIHKYLPQIQSRYLDQNNQQFNLTQVLNQGQYLLLRIFLYSYVQQWLLITNIMKKYFMLQNKSI
ncbi:unnamed protein product [Paramecium octaurelia]|uniref:Uncharacterized protein n=1 Tax=Paramecium octaurelia TaxID=43137 RepID=A0A8S1T707_PAROT|nr:unnamed protein product [Paramecium octaurelia]